LAENATVYVYYLSEKLYITATFPAATSATASGRYALDTDIYAESLGKLLNVHLNAYLNSTSSFHLYSASDRYSDDFEVIEYVPASDLPSAQSGSIPSIRATTAGTYSVTGTALTFTFSGGVSKTIATTVTVTLVATAAGMGVSYAFDCAGVKVQYSGGTVPALSAVFTYEGHDFRVEASATTMTVSGFNGRGFTITPLT
jgi:hypothetical protein